MNRFELLTVIRKNGFGVEEFQDFGEDIAAISVLEWLMGLTDEQVLEVMKDLRGMKK